MARRFLVVVASSQQDLRISHLMSEHLRQVLGVCVILVASFADVLAVFFLSASLAEYSFASAVCYKYCSAWTGSGSFLAGVPVWSWI
jgi:hypothetical protein